MAALSVNLDMPLLGGGVKLTGPASGAQTVFAGSFIYALAAGKFAISGQGAGDRIVGIATKKQVIAAADDPIEYVSSGHYLFPALASVTAADTGSAVIMKGATLTNNPADCVSMEDTTAADNDIYVGRIVGWDTALARPIVNCEAMGFINTVTTGALKP